MVKKPDARLHDLATLYEERGKLYGDTGLHKIGHVLYELFDSQLELRSPADFQRAFLVFMAANKLARYATRFSAGGHEDSLNDLAVYAQMLAAVDEACGQ